MTQKPFLNLGAGRIILPGERPAHHGLVDEAIYQYPLWKNVDRNPQPGIDECVDVFTYPWPWPDNSFDGALLSHLCEHIPHEIRIKQTRPSPEFIEAQEQWTDRMFTTMKRGDPLRPKWNYSSNVHDKYTNMQDGWYAFMFELWRVLTPGAIAHILSPYAWSAGAVTDPTHTRYLTEHTFTHSMAPDPDSPFEYATGGLHFEMESQPVFRITEMFQHLADDPQELTRALQTRLNVAYELYVRLRAVK